MRWYEQYSPGRLGATGLAALVGLYLFGIFGAAPAGPVAAFFITITALYFAWAWLGPLVDDYLLFPSQRDFLRTLRAAGAMVEDLRRVYAKRHRKLDRGPRKAVEQAIEALESALESRDQARIETALEAAERVAAEQLRVARKGVLRDFFESIGGALLVALLLRVFVIEAFKIPSGSMIPTLAIGDHIFVNKFAYGIAVPTLSGQYRLLSFTPPKSGDVVVFIAPEPADNAGEDFIKRVVAGPGQTVKVEDGTLYVDGEIQARTRGEAYSYDEFVEEIGVLQRFHATRYTETTGGVDHSVLLNHLANNSWPSEGLQLNGVTCTGGSCKVDDGYIFCMGDNRDNSSDSRRWGAVPVENAKGRAMFVWLSFASTREPGTLLGVRWSRIGTWIE